MPDRLFIALCGLIGAALYAVPIYIMALRMSPPLRFAWVMLLFSLSIGLVGAPIFVPLLGHQWPFLVVPEPYPLAVAVGLAINPLAPIFIKKLTGWADGYQIGTSK